MWNRIGGLFEFYCDPCMGGLEFSHLQDKRNIEARLKWLYTCDNIWR